MSAPDVKARDGRTAGLGDPTAQLTGKVAVVTGAARGLGLGIASELAAGGAIVYCADLTAPHGVLSDLPCTGGRAGPTGPARVPDRAETSHHAVALDVTDPDAVDDLAAQVLSRHSRLDVWVNNAGVVAPPAPVHLTPRAEVLRMIDVNVLGAVSGCRAAAAAMIQAGYGGRIINVSSGRARIAWAGLGVYGATKAAVVALTQAMALELAAEGVTVNAICPGTMWTDMAEGAFTQIAADSRTSLAELMVGKIAQIPVGRLGTPADAGAVAAFLAGPGADFITGAAINLTGGEDLF